MKIVAATLLGPPGTQHFWGFCRREAEEWADDIVIEYDEHGAAWGAENNFRRRLWQKAVDAAGDDGWIFILDSDFVLTFDPREIAEMTHANSVRFVVYDLWSPTQYREDVFWHAHGLPRHWMFHVSGSPEEPDWNPRGIHTGHAPNNFRYEGYCVPPFERYAILHLGWMTPDVRQEKYERYKRVWRQLSGYERKHVKSILDPSPTLNDLPPGFTDCLEGLPLT